MFCAKFWSPAPDQFFWYVISTVLDYNMLVYYMLGQYARGKVIPPVFFGVGSMACLFSLKQ